MSHKLQKKQNLTLNVRSRSLAKVKPTFAPTQKVNGGKSTGLKPRSLSTPTRVKTSGGLQPSGIVEDLYDTGKTIAKNVATLAEGNPMGLLEIPNTILKVVDTSKNVIRNLQGSDVKNPVVVPDKQEVATKNDELVVQKLKDNMPVMTTTQIPGQYSYEMSAPPLTQSSSFDASINRQVHRYSGAYNTGTLAGSYSTPTWIRAARITPADATLFGPRMRTIAGTYQLWRLNSITLHYVPNVGTDYVGSIMLNINEGTDIVNQFVNGSDAPKDVSQREHWNSGPARTPLQLTVKGRGDWKYLYSSAGSEDLKWFSSMTAGAMMYDCVTGAPSPGQLYVLFDVEFCSAMEDLYSFSSQLRHSFLSNWVARSPTHDFDLYLKAIRYFANNLELVKDINDSDRKLMKLFDTPFDRRESVQEWSPIEYLKKTRKSKTVVSSDIIKRLEFVSELYYLEPGARQKFEDDLKSDQRIVKLFKDCFDGLFGLVLARMHEFGRIIGMTEIKDLISMVKVVIINTSDKLYDDRHPTMFDDDYVFLSEY